MYTIQLYLFLECQSDDNFTSVMDCTLVEAIISCPSYNRRFDFKAKSYELHGPGCYPNNGGLVDELPEERARISGLQRVYLR
jgi:hypothetical protein